MTRLIRVSTIGFTQTSAKRFFERLEQAQTKKVLDVRLNNSSQLAGFAKGNDLSYFLTKISNIDYGTDLLLAPTQDILKAFKKEKGDWSVYEDKFLSLMAQRKIEEKLKPEMLEGVCLLCSEATPHQCHRRLVCEYLNKKWGNILDVKHL